MGRDAVLVAALLCAAASFLPVDGHAAGFRAEQQKHARVRGAYAAHRDAVEEAFKGAGASWPPKRVLLRAFKHEQELEVWAGKDATGPLVKVRTMPVCASSGVLGPKRARGDLQIPEGYYELVSFNPVSSFHLALRVGYPNRSDTVRGAKDPGGDIMVHGNCVTIGCLPMTDAGIEWLYVAAVEAKEAGQTKLPIHLFPARFDRNAEVLARHAAVDPKLAAFWDELRAGYERFEQTRVPAKYRIARDGRYVFEGADVAEGLPPAAARPSPFPPRR